MNRWKIWIAAALVSISFVWGTKAVGAEIGWIEDYSLARDRIVPLKQLIPGTKDYYYYFYCLHYQATEQWDKVDETLKAWIDAINTRPACWRSKTARRCSPTRRIRNERWI